MSSNSSDIKEKGYMGGNSSSFAFVRAFNIKEENGLSKRSFFDGFADQEFAVPDALS